MADMKHTNGPWERVDTPDYAEIHPKGQRLHSAIALVGKPGDADLIAAAPALLSALKTLSAVYDGIYVKMSDGEMELCRHAWAEAEAALSKAGG